MSKEKAAANDRRPDPAPTSTPTTPVAPAAHGSQATPPTPPAWSYRAAGAPIDPSAAPTADDPALAPASRGQSQSPAARTRPDGAPALPGPARTLATSLGPAGRARSPLVVVVLSVLTLGVYALIWYGRVNAEVSDFDPRMRVRTGGSTLAVAIPWLLGLLVSLAGAARIVLDQLKVTLPRDPHFTVQQAYYLLAGIGAVPYIALVLPFSLIAIVMTLERIRIAEERVGTTPDKQVQPTRVVWLLLVPVLGGLALMSTMQRRLNRIWQQSAPRPAGLRT